LQAFDQQKLRALGRSVVESAMDAIVVVDAAQRIVLYNNAAEQIFLHPRAGILGQPLNVLLPERFRAVHGEHVERFGHTGETSRRMGARMVLRGLRANGEEFPVEASIAQSDDGEAKIFTVILRDVTERVQADESLAKSEARLRGILDSAMDAVITVDDAQHIVLFNTAAESVFGYSQEEAMGAPLSLLMPQRFRAEHDKHVSRFGETGVTSRRMDPFRVLSGLRRNGEEFPIEASISQVEENGHRFYTVILRDVTDRVRADDALRQSKEELRELAALAQSVREQEKSRIARELHDELGQSLTALKMDVIALRGEVPAERPVMAERVARIETMLNQTVAATRRISADLRPLMLDDLGLAAAVEWVVQEFTERSSAVCKVVVEGDLDLEDPHATAVFRVLQESLTNIAKHAQATRVNVGIERTHDEVHLRVQDNGIGFSLESPRKRNSHGLLGVRERAYLLGGKSSIVSAPGEGTVVELWLPLPA
jgi:PAS domain S-box-containing protein